MPRLLIVLVVLLAAGCTSAIPGTPQARQVVNCEFNAPRFGETGITVPRPGTEAPKQGVSTLTLETNQGPLTISLDASASPCSVHNFKYLVGRGFYNNTNCHRVTTAPNLKIVQCGDPTASGIGNPGYEFDDTIPVDAAYERGTVAMANAGDGTNGCQFFIVYGTAEIPATFPLLGKVTGDLAPVDKVAAAGSLSGSDGKPNVPLTITKASIA